MIFLKLNGFRYKKQFDLDDPLATITHRDIIMSKPFLKRTYLQWYNVFNQASRGVPPGKLVEIGSGGGFIKEIMPDVITSDILPLDYCDMTFSAQNMPFKKAEVSAIFMINVLHHIPDPVTFFIEAMRVLKPGGKIVMIEPANTYFSRIIYKRFHHEPFDENSKWNFDSKGPLSDANGALPWIIFCRDRKIFEKSFPDLTIQIMENHSTFIYLLSGGLTMKQLVPLWSFRFFTGLERLIKPISGATALFTTIELLKKNTSMNEK